MRLSIDDARRSGRIFDGTITVPGGLTSTGEDLTFDMIAFGNGEQPLLIIPGLGDGLATVSGKGKLLARYYKSLPNRYRTFMVSRPNELTSGYTTRAMAADYTALCDVLGFPAGSLDLWGASQGGMIAQWLAIDHPKVLRRLCITVSTPHATKTLQEVVGAWIELAKSGRYGDLTRDTMRKTFSAKHLKKYALVMPILGLIGKPKSFDRFIVQAESCLSHDARDELHRVATPTLVVGGGKDLVVGEGTSEAIAALIPNAELKIYPELGHGAYEEAKECTDMIMEFFA